MPIWIKEKLFIKRTLKKELKKFATSKKDIPKLYFPEHHLSHAASAYYPADFDEALILTIDGVGEYATTLLAHGKGNIISPLLQLSFPHSLGLLYASVTYYLGFKINSGEYKVMGLAAYGDDASDQYQFFYNQIKTHLINIKDDGSFWLDQQYFEYMSGLKMCNHKKWEKLFGIKRRNKNEPLDKSHHNLALAFQKITEEIVIQLVKTGKELTGAKNLCLAGGVTLNCVANGEILKRRLVNSIFVQPAAGDAGGAIGAALALNYLQIPEQTRPKIKSHVYLGPQPGDFTPPPNDNITITHFTDFQNLCDSVATHIQNGHTVAWVQDRMEFGPRALGNRSILANPTLPHMMQHINTLIKNREAFRPFAPVVLEEDAAEYFDMLDMPSSPHMLFTFTVKSKTLPAITHIDNSARVQTVNKIQNEKLCQLLNSFKQKTNCSVLLNTSFNVKDQPIVCNAEEAYQSFLNMQLDHLVVQNVVYSKK